MRNRGGENQDEEPFVKGDTRQCNAQGDRHKKMVTPAARREAVAQLRVAFEVSERRACSTLGADRRSVRYRSRRPDDAPTLIFYATSDPLHGDRVTDVIPSCSFGEPQVPFGYTN